MTLEAKCALGRLGAFTDRAQHQPGPGAAQKPDQPGSHSHGHIQQRVLAEQRRAEEGNVRQQRDVNCACSGSFSCTYRMPTTAENPAPNRLSARPVAYWLVFSQITSTPNTAAAVFSG